MHLLFLSRKEKKFVKSTTIVFHYMYSELELISWNIFHVRVNFRYKSLYKMWVLRIPPADTPPFPSSMSAHTKITTDIRPNAIPPMWVNLYRALSTTQLNIKTVGMEKQSSSWKKKYNFIRFFSQKKLFDFRFSIWEEKVY